MWPLHTATPAPAVPTVLARHARRNVLLSSGSVDGGIAAAEPIARLHAAVERTVESATETWTAELARGPARVAGAVLIGSRLAVTTTVADVTGRPAREYRT